MIPDLFDAWPWPWPKGWRRPTLSGFPTLVRATTTAPSQGGVTVKKTTASRVSFAGAPVNADGSADYRFLADVADYTTGGQGVAVQITGGGD